MGGLLERDEQLRALTHLAAEAVRGAGSMAFVSGEAGAGKTAVVTELARRVGPDMRVLWGFCDPLSTPRPLGPLHDLAVAEREIARLLAADASGSDLFHAVLGQLRGGRPALVIVEDAHWADDGTLDFLRFAGRRIADTNSVLVATYRDDEVGAGHPLRVVIGQLGRVDSTVRIAIPPLSTSALAALVEGTGVDPATLQERTGGNAFFATEILAAGGDLPERVQDAVLARLSRLGDDARRAVDGVSIAPRSMPRGHVAALTGASAEDIARATDAGMLVDEGDTVRFRHELARLAVITALAPSTRIELHRRMVDILLADPAPDRAAVAHHAVGSGIGPLIAEHAPTAADDAAHSGAHRQAVAFLTSAVEHGAHLGGDELARLRRRLATELAIVDRHTEAVAQTQAAVDHFRTTGDAVELAASLGELARAHWRTQHAAEAVRAVHEAIELLTPLDEPRALAEAQYSLGYLAMLARRLQPARDAIARSRDSSARAEEDPELRWGQDLIDGCIRIIGEDADGGLDSLRQLLADARLHGSTRRVGITLGMLGTGGAEARLYHQAVPALEETVALGLVNDDDYGVAYSRSWLARAAFEQGRWSEAAALAELVDEVSIERSGIAMMTALGALGRVRVRRGDPGGVRLLQELYESRDRHELQHVWSPVCGLAESLWLTGRRDEMVPVLDDSYERALAADSMWARGEVGFWMWRAGAIDAPPEGSAPPFRFQMEGDWEAAAAAWREIGCPYEVALALADGDEPAMRGALAIFDGLGARPVAGWLRARMRDRGVERITRGPNTATRRNPAGLTTRQLDVLELMIEGSSNGEIAEALFVSKKTVEHHVSAIFAKLGVTDRGKAIARGRSLLED